MTAGAEWVQAHDAEVDRVTAASLTHVDRLEGLLGSLGDSVHRLRVALDAAEVEALEFRGEHDLVVAENEELRVANGNLNARVLALSDAVKELEERVGTLYVELDAAQALAREIREAATARLEQVHASVTDALTAWRNSIATPESSG